MVSGNAEYGKDGTASAAIPSSAAKDVEETKDRRGIQSIEVGGQLLLALGRTGKPMVLKELAREAGMPAAKAHPYLVSFAKLGLIEQDLLTGRYELGPQLLQLGLVSLQRLNPVRIATKEIATLSTDTGHTVAIAVWGEHGTNDHLGPGIKPRPAYQPAHRHGDVSAEHGDWFGLRSFPSAQSRRRDDQERSEPAWRAG